ncbi:hypothetical protein KXS07_37380, partial [Inquilinus limosus]|uniref:hypothetical protein n=1 Tax=Inquilinus limosus TaxID=171674 RepID=UPI003F136D52
MRNQHALPSDLSALLYGEADGGRRGSPRSVTSALLVQDASAASADGVSAKGRIDPDEGMHSLEVIGGSDDDDII